MLTHKSTFGDDSVAQNSCSARTGKSFLSHGESSSSRFECSWKKGNPSKICNYCQRKGHWKNDSPVLKEKLKFSSRAQINPAALAPSVVSTAQMVFHFSTFISDGYVSLFGEKVAVKILRDTGAKHSLVCETVLPFSSVSNTGNFILMRGMGMSIISVPVHKMELACGLVTGEVAVGVRPALLWKALA